MSDKCEVKDGAFVEPCKMLEGVVDNNTPAFSKTKGVSVWHTFNWKTGKPGRTFFGVKSKGYPKGVAFNFCPFCGTQIDAPFNKEEDAAA